MTIRKFIHGSLNKLPYIRGLYRENLNFKKNCSISAGHYASTIISVDDIHNREASIWEGEKSDGIIGIELNTENQLKLVKDFQVYYQKIPFREKRSGSLRYYFDNSWYTYTDAIFLYSMIMHFKPKKIIEVGSGYSSSIMLDTNELHFNNGIHLTFVEPNPQRLYSLIKDEDKKSTSIIENYVQSVALDIYEELNADDILFIDSSHAAKTGSDVNHILFNVLPTLKSGVLIHFHDIFYPFEYPREWVYGGLNYNEGYFLKAFLMYNSEFEIILFSDYLLKHHSALFQEMPLCYKNFGGNIWLRKK
jgi:hypothetical protein